MTPIPLFIIGDIMEMRDRSQWEIVNASYEEAIEEYVYEIEEIQSRGFLLRTESELNRAAIVVKFADKIPKERTKGAKVYRMEDYRKQRA